MNNKLALQLSLKPIVYNLPQHYCETQSNMLTGKVSMNKILENAHSCVTILRGCTVIEKEYSFVNVNVCPFSLFGNQRLLKVRFLLITTTLCL